MLKKIEKLNNIKVLFFISIIGIITIYLSVLGVYRTINIITSEYLLILLTIPILFIIRHYKKRLKGIEIVDFTQNSNISLKYTIVFFLVFQVMDYYYEGGFIGMISQWFLYWILGIITILLMDCINYYKNFKYLLKK